MNVKRTVAALSRINRRFLKSKEAKRLLGQFLEKAKIDPELIPSVKPPVELATVGGMEVFFVNKEPIFARANNRLFPTLKSEGVLSKMPKATVNMGAVPHVCNGADVMAPGIVQFAGEFQREDIVVVFDERHHAPIAVTIALHSSEEAEKLEHGKILKNIHYVGDALWNILKHLGKLNKA